MLIKYELRKLFAGRIKWILFLLVLLNAFFYYLYLLPSILPEEKKSVYAEVSEMAEQAGSQKSGLAMLEGEIEALQHTMQKNLEAGRQEYLTPEESIRWDMLTKRAEEYRDALQFDAFVGEIDARAEKLLRFSIFSKEGSFSKRNIVKTRDEFLELKGLEVSPQDGTGLNVMQNFVLTDLILLVGICLLSFQIFGKDGQSGMRKLLNVSINGRGRLRLLQMGAVAAGVLLFALFLYGNNFILTQELVGFPEWTAEIHGIGEYRNIPFACTVQKYLFLCVCWKLTASVAVAVLFQTVIYRMNGNKICWMTLGAGVVVSFLLWLYFPENPTAKIFRYLNVVGIFDTAEFLGDYQNLNLFGYPVGLLKAGIAAMLAVTVAGLVLAAGFGKSPDGFIIKTREKPIPRKIRTNVFFYEWYKNLWVQKAGIIMLLLIVFVGYRGISSVSQEEYIQREEYHYEQLAKDFIGKSEKELENALTALDEKGMTFTDNAQFQAAERIRRQAEQLLGTSKEGVFVNERIWNNILFDVETELEDFMIFLICMILALSGVFQYESVNKMRILLHSTVKSNRIYWSKLGVACVTGGLFALIIWGARYAVLFVKYQGVEGFAYPVQSLAGFQEFPLEVSIGVMTGMLLLQKILSGVIIAVILFFLSQWLVSSFQVIIASMLLFVLTTGILIVANMEYQSPLVSLFKYHLEPLLQYIYMASSWASVFHKVPGFAYAVIAAGVAAGVWAGRKRWINGA